VSVLAILDMVQEFISNDVIGYFSSRPKRLLLVAVVAIGGGVLAAVLDRLSHRTKRAVRLVGWGAGATFVTGFSAYCVYESFAVSPMVSAQYLLAADRVGGGRESSYEPLHPAVVQVLSRLAAAAEAKGRPISLCGEIASDPAYTKLLLGLGYRSFSVSPRRCLEIKHAIRSIDLSEARQLATKALASSSAHEIRAHVQEEWNRRRPIAFLDLPQLNSRAGTLPFVTHDASSRRFEIRTGDDTVAFLSYTCDGDQIILEHTHVPNELRGKGIAANLARAALEEAGQRRWSVIPRCSYVAGFIKRNPQFGDLVEPQART
jgi:predicted GNAT family acetyltransferase